MSESATFAQPAAAPTSAALPDFDPTEATQRTIQQLSAALSDPYTPAPEREEIARRLLAQSDPAAKTALLGALREQTLSSVAVARALADSGRRDPDFVETLFACFTANKNLTEAAAAALGNYKGNPQVINRLISIAANRQKSIEDIRLAAIRALGAFSEKSCAETLIALLRNPNESVRIRGRAADALASLSGVEPDEIRDWDQWWIANSRRNDAEFRAEMLERKAASRERDLARIAQLASTLETSLRAQYQQTPPNKRDELLIGWLRAGVPEIRARAAAQVQEDWSANNPAAPAVYDELRKMIGDSSPTVRKAVVTALWIKNDKESLEPLLQQLAQESDPLVRGQIALALKEINDVRSAPALVKLLNDPAPTVVRAAVGALQPLGKAILEQRPALAEQIAVTLRDIIERTASNGQVELRADAVMALVPLKQRGLIMSLYLKLLTPREDARVRIAALQALGELRDNNTAFSVIEAIADPDDSVVLQAVKTLGQLAPTPDQANALLPLLVGDRVRADPTIKAEAWLVLQSILPSMSNEQLTNWAEKFRGDPARQIAIRLQLAKVLTAEKDLDKLAITQSQIARHYMDLKPAQSDAALPFLRAALEYRQGNHEAGAQVDELIDSYMEAALSSGKFEDAIAFAEKTMKNDISKQGKMAPLIKDKVEVLAQSNATDELKDASRLIKLAKNMNPPLGGRYVDALDALQKSVDDRLAKLNQGSTGPRSANGFAAPTATRPAILAGEGN
ncbi:MAG: HEAT repeat domain-containing protein [Anaerolineae bacterium]|nr:HEAT repeat domain-containing protein [Phycisphaerae bacterium]